MRRVALAFVCTSAVLLVFLASLLYASSNSPTTTVGRTQKTAATDSQSCGGCHATKDTGITGSFSGPSELYAGDFGNYIYTVSKTTTEARKVGINIAVSGASNALTVTSGSEYTTTATSANTSTAEVTHSSGGALANLRRLSGGSVSYNFRYTMPPAQTGAATLYGTAVVGTTTTIGASGTTSGTGWNHTATKSVSVKALPTAPASLTAGTPTSSTVPLSWSGGGPRYRVLAKTGTYATSPTDGSATLVYDGTGTSATATGLAASTAYFFSAYSKDLGIQSGAAFYSTAAATTTAATGMALDPNPYVDAVSGSDSNAGSSDAPFKTIKKALTAVGSGGTITVRPGTYNTTLGETFPITIPSGIKLKSTGGAAVTVIDATGANTRVIYCSGNASTTLVEGFTIKGGLVQTSPGGSNASGGGILTEAADQTTFSRCIITGNQARGYNGDSTYTVGGHAYGGGAAILGSSSTKFINCVISNNTARGGDGATTVGGGVTGGEAHGGGVWAAGAATFINNTVYSNQAIGGKGGDTTGGGAGGTGGNAFYGALESSGTAQNNIFSSNSVTGGTGGSPGGSTGSATTGGITASTVSYNLFHNHNGTGGDGYTGTNAITGQDPLFISSSDLHLRSSSPARRAGLTTGAPTVDLEGTARATPPTIGAYEITLSLSAAAGIGHIRLTWPGVYGASSYNLYMARASGVTPANYLTLSGGRKVTGVTSPYLLSPLQNNDTWYFVLTAVENSTEGPASPEVSATSANGTWVKEQTLSIDSFKDIARDLSSTNTIYAAGYLCASPPCTGPDGALYRSTDGGITWANISGTLAELPLIAVAANGSTIFVATKDGDIYRSTDSGSNWTQVLDATAYGEPAISLEIDPFNSSTIYSGDYNGVSGGGGLLIRSTDGGNTWASLASSNLHAYEIATDPNTSGTIYGSGTGTPNVGKSTDNGTSWSSIQPGTGYAKRALAAGPGVLFSGVIGFDGTTSLGIYKSTNAGASWTSQNTGLPGTLPEITTFAIDPTNVNKVHVSTSAGYYNSTDGAANWAAGPTGGPYSSATLNLYGMTISGRRRLTGIYGGGIYMRTLEPAPSINSLSPNSGPSAGGTTVTINGTGFNYTTGLHVLFDTAEATISSGSSTSITVTTPAHAGGTVDVWVINPDGQAALFQQTFTYINCTYQLSAASADYTPAAATGSVQVTAPNGCPWTATAPGGSFVTITSGASGSGNGTVGYSVAANTTGSARDTTLTIGGQSFTVNQSGAGSTAILDAVGSASQVALTWTAVSGATSYDVRKSIAGGSLGLATTTNSLSYNDTAVTSGTGYLYRIDAYGSSGFISSSNVDLAVVYNYTDGNLVAGTTPVRAAHFTELRAAVNAARTALSMGSASFTGTISAGGVVMASHLTELRTQVNAVRSNLGIGTLSYTDPTVTGGSTIVRTSHIQELRNGLQ